MRIIIAIAIVATMVSCNKTKRSSNHFIDAGVWNVTTITIDGTAVDELPKWEVEDCDLYEENCHAEWKTDEGEERFVWQFRDKGKTFEISRQAEEGHDEGEEHDHEGEDEHGHGHGADAYELSGVYEVVESAKDAFEFKSSATLGHAGEEVVIKISK